jgi:hypothetical protein
MFKKQIEQENPFKTRVRNAVATDKETWKSMSGAVHIMRGTIVNWLLKTQ